MGTTAVFIDFTILFLALQGVLLWLVTADKSLSLAERLSASLTFNLAGWTSLSIVLGFAGLFRTGWVLFGAGLLIVCLLLLGWAMGLERPSAKGFRRDAMAIWEFAMQLRAPGWTMAALGCVAAGSFLLLGIRLPVIDYDGISYHLGMALHIAQDGDFRDYPGESLYTSHFARGGELLMALTILALGSFNLVNAVQWVMLPVLLPAVYATGRALGLDRTHAAVAAFLPLTVPVILYQSSMAYVDLYSVGFFSAGLLAVLGARNRGVGPARILWMFACAGLAMGAKFNAAILAVLLGVVALAAWGWRPLLAPHRRALGLALTGFLLAAAVGTPWMVRNWVKWGSPIYPFSVSIGNVVLAEGMLGMEHTRRMAEGEEYFDVPLWEKTWLSWTTLDLDSWYRFGFLGRDFQSVPHEVLHDHSFGYRGDIRFGGFGLVWVAVLLPSMIVLAIWVLVDRLRGNARTDLWKWHLLTVLAPFAAFLIIVAPWWTRFSIFMPIVGALCFALLVERLSSRYRLAGSLLLWSGITVAAFDWATAVFLNRQWEMLRRYEQDTGRISQTPVHFFTWAAPADPLYRAIEDLLEEARPNETISYYTPYEPILTGFFTEETATVRLNPFPTFWPPFHFDIYPPEALMEIVREDEIALMLLSRNSTPIEFVRLLMEEGAEFLFEHGPYRAYEIPQHRRELDEN